MKKSMCILICLFFCAISSAQQDKTILSLSLELVNPNGCIDEQSYFRAALKNRDKKAAIVVGWQRNEKDLGGHPNRSYQIQEFEIKDGTKKESSRLAFFPYKYENQSALKILPQSFITIEIPLLGETAPAKYFGVLPTKKILCEQIKRVRIRLEQLTYGGVYTIEGNERNESGKIDLVSNWIDLSNADYSKVFK